jgi:hypothetical protein
MRTTENLYYGNNYILSDTSHPNLSCVMRGDIVNTYNVTTVTVPAGISTLAHGGQSIH